MRLDFAAIAEWQVLGLQAEAAADGSLLSVADVMTEPQQVSHHIGYLLHTAVDHLHALKILMGDAGAQHTFAPYTLIRGAIENASAALWILQYDEPKRVAARSLQLEYASLLDEERAVKTVDPNAKRDTEIMCLLETTLARSGLKKDEVKARPPGQLRIIEEASNHFNISNSAVTWQMCSAAAHGRKWARTLLTHFEPREDDGVSKVLHGRLTSKDMSVAIALRVACEVVRKAREVRSRYSRNPLHTGSSFFTKSVP